MLDTRVYIKAPNAPSLKGVVPTVGVSKRPRHRGSLPSTGRAVGDAALPPISCPNRHEGNAQPP